MLFLEDLLSATPSPCSIPRFSEGSPNALEQFGVGMYRELEMLLCERGYVEVCYFRISPISLRIILYSYTHATFEWPSFLMSLAVIFISDLLSGVPSYPSRDICT